MSRPPKRNRHTHRDRPIDRGPRTANLEQLCPVSKKRKYTSAGAARRGGAERYGATPHAYRCRACGAWHVSRNETPMDPRVEPKTDPQLDALVDLAIGMGATK